MVFRKELGTWKRVLKTMEKSAKSIVGACHAEGSNDERGGKPMKGNENASDNLKKAAREVQDELVSGESEQPESIQARSMMDQVLERGNLQKALKQVCQNKGASGIDGMSVEELLGYLKRHWCWRYGSKLWREGIVHNPCCA